VTLSMARVRFVRVLQVAAYAAPITLIIFVLGLDFPAAALAKPQHSWPRGWARIWANQPLRETLFGGRVLVLAAVIAWQTLWWYCANRFFLRLSQPGLITAVTMILATLATITILFLTPLRTSLIAVFTL